MTRTLAALFAILLFLPAASFQEDDKERAKAEAKQREDDAKAALKAYREKRNKPGSTADDHIEAIQGLEGAEPHPLIRAELAKVLEGDRSIEVRIAAAGALGKFKKDVAASEILLRNAKGQKDEGLKKKCLQKYGFIAPFGRSENLRVFFNEENNDIVKEAIEAVESINSVRMLKPLIELLAELENIREDKGESGSGGPPLPGVPQGESSNQQRIKRKRELTAPVRKAINSIWKKYDSQTKLNNSTDAFAQLRRNQTFLSKIQETEDREDKGIKESPSEMK